MTHPELARAITVINRLRDPQEGCPWDLAQTHESLLEYLIEESYEYIESVEMGDPSKMCEELGDVLLQVILHARIAEQAGTFNLEDVARKIANKMVHRHPHVFGEEKEQTLTPQEVKERWELRKQDEQKTARSHIPAKLMHHPALKTAHLIGLASHKIAFDWPDHQQVLLKVEEEWQEFKTELAAMNKEKIAEEMGDLFFSMAQLARHLGLDAEETLRQGNKKFLKRFHHLEEIALKRGLKLEVLSSSEMEELWVQAKKELSC